MATNLTSPVDVGTSPFTPLSTLDVASATTPGVAIGSYAGTLAAPIDGLIVSGPVAIGTLSSAPTNPGLIVGGPGMAGSILAETTDVTTNSAAVLSATADTTRLSVISHGSARTVSRYGLTLGGWAEASDLNVTSNISNGFVIGIQASSPLVFGTDNLERVRIDGSGNVGIGTATPADLLDVNGASIFRGSVDVTALSAGGLIKSTAGILGIATPGTDYTISATANTVALLRALTSTAWIDGTIVYLFGYNTRDDGGGGAFEWNASDTTADNDGTIIKLTGTTTGRLRRIAASSVGHEQATTLDCRWFGMIPDFATDQSSTLANIALVFPTNSQGTIYCPSGTYLFAGVATISGGAPGNLTIRGDGNNSTLFYNTVTTAGILNTSGNITITDIGFLTNAGANAHDIIYCHDGSVSLFNLSFGAFTTTAAAWCIHLSNVALAQIRNIYTSNLDGGQLLLESVGGFVHNCYLSAGDSDGITVFPCVTVRAASNTNFPIWVTMTSYVVGNIVRDPGDSDLLFTCISPIPNSTTQPHLDATHWSSYQPSQTSLKLSGSTFKGQGPYSPYDGGTTYSTVVLSCVNGPAHEGQINDCMIDTTATGGLQQNTIGILAEGISNSSFDVGGWTIGNIYSNGVQDTIRLNGQDAGSYKNVSNFCISNIYAVGGNVSTTTGVAVNMIDCHSVNISGIHLGNSGGLTDAIHIYNLGSNAMGNFTLTGIDGGRFDEAANRALVTVYGDVKNVFGTFNTVNAGTAYTLSGGASKANGIAFLWPDGAGGINCSGSLSQNV